MMWYLAILGGMVLSTFHLEVKCQQQQQQSLTATAKPFDQVLIPRDAKELSAVDLHTVITVVDDGQETSEFILSDIVGDNLFKNPNGNVPAPAEGAKPKREVTLKKLVAVPREAAAAGVKEDLPRVEVEALPAGMKSVLSRRKNPAWLLEHQDDAPSSSRKLRQIKVVKKAKKIEADFVPAVAQKSRQHKQLQQQQPLLLLQQPQPKQPLLQLKPHHDQVPQQRLQPQQQQNKEVANGKYNYRYETVDGVSRQEEGYLKSSGSAEEDPIQVAIGSYSYPGTDGLIYTVEYIADEKGFQPKGPHIKRPQQRK